MSLLEKNQNRECTVIIGCGRLGASIANALSNEGGNVLIMDDNPNSFRRLAPNFGGLSIVASGVNLDKLREIEIEKATSVIVVTNDDNTNIMVAQMVSEIFGVKRVIARLYDPESESVYKKFGINTICPSVLSAKEIDKMLAD